MSLNLQVAFVESKKEEAYFRKKLLNIKHLFLFSVQLFF